MELLQAPRLVAADEMPGEIVEQPRVRRRLSHSSKFIRRLYDALSEIELPDSIDNDAGRERILGIGQPAGQCQASPRRVGSCLGRLYGKGPGIQNRQWSRLYRYFGTRNPRGCSGASGISHRHHARQWGRATGVQLLAEIFPLLLLLAFEFFRDVGSAVQNLSVDQVRQLPLEPIALRFRFRVDRLDIFGKLSDLELLERPKDGIFDLCQLRLQLCRLPFPLFQLLPVVGDFVSGSCRSVIVEQQRSKTGSQAVVIFAEDGIELVIVATGARHRESQKGLADDVGQFVDDQRPVKARVPLVRFVDTQPQERRGDAHVGVIGSQFIAGELLHHETIVRFVAVESRHHIVSVPPGRSSEGVGPVAVRFRETDKIQPHLRHPFAEMRTG